MDWFKSHLAAREQVVSIENCLSCPKPISVGVPQGSILANTICKDTICKDNKLREIYFKPLQRTIVTKKELFLYGKEDNMLCTFCQMNDSIIHTFQNCSCTKLFFSEVIKWFNSENATSLSFSQMETMFGRKLNKKNAEQYPERKLNFTLLFAKYYLYNAKLTHEEISMFDFIAKLTHKYSLEGLNV